MFTVLLRKASGAGYYAMAGLPYDPVVQLSTPITRLAVMEGRTLAIGAFNTRLDDNFQHRRPGPGGAGEDRGGHEGGRGRGSAADMDPYRVRRARWTPTRSCALDELRAYLEVLVEMCYQSIGYRRVKNPRIWSLHDLAVLSEEPR